MRLAALALCWLSAFAAAQERRPEIDPNTKIEGGADPRSSGEAAGAGGTSDTNPEPRRESEPRAVTRPGEPSPEDKDKPTAERKPEERGPEDAVKGEARKF